MKEEKRVPIRLPYQTLAVLFDLDNTLYSREQAFEAWGRSFIKSHVANGDEREIEQRLKQLIAWDNYGMTPREKLFQQVSGAYTGLSAPVEELITAYRQELSLHITPDESMPGLLLTLKEAAIPFGIITNGSVQNQQRKIRRLGLEQFTSCIFISEAFGVKKPDASIFLAAASCLNMKPEEILFVGDHPYLDMWGAHAIGMKTAWLHSSLPWPADLSSDVADITIDSLHELLALIG